MIIEMKKIGTVLDSRPAGKEALLAMRPHIKDAKEVVIDFSGVNVLTPSFADEFVTPLQEEFGNNLSLMNELDNITVRTTLEFLAEE